jgi:hypothetical protein
MWQHQRLQLTLTILTVSPQPKNAEETAGSLGEGI